MKLSTILERVNPVQKVLNKLKGQSSWDCFSYSYQHLVIVRRMLERSLILSKKERNKKVQKLKQMEDDRVKKDDGTFVSPLEIDDLKREYWFFDRRTVGFLKKVQDLENEWFSLLSVRGLDILTDEDIEDVTLYVPREELDKEVGRQ